MAVFGESASVKTAWRSGEVARELSYTQLWTLVDEGYVDKVRFYGPARNTAMVLTKASAPGGQMLRKVVLPPDAGLLDHLLAHGVGVEGGAMLDEKARLQGALMAQVRALVWCGALGKARMVGCCSLLCTPIPAAAIAGALTPAAAGCLLLRLQVVRYTVPFLVISGLFWLLHTWALDPMPNAFKRREFIR